MKKRILFLLLCVLLLIPFCKVTAAGETTASGKAYTLETVPNVRLSNALNHVSDPDGIIGTEYTAQIDSVLNVLEDSTGCQVAIVAVYSINNDPPREFANDLFKKWGIGIKKQDNGLLILLVTNKDERSITFETGYGIEGDLPDAICKRIQTIYMVPDMSQGNYGAGMFKGVEATAKILQGYENVTSDRSDTSDSGFFPTILFFIGFIAFILFWPILALVRLFPKKCPRCQKRTYKRVRSTIIQRATSMHDGLKQEEWRCSSCGYTMKIDIKIHRYSDPSGGGGFIGGGMGGSSWGGGSAGGSWGGGGSGGGGASTRF